MGTRSRNDVFDSTSDHSRYCYLVCLSIASATVCNFDPAGLESTLFEITPRLRGSGCGERVDGGRGGGAAEVCQVFVYLSSSVVELC